MREPKSTAQYIWLIKELKDDAWKTEEEYIFILEKSMQMNLWPPNFWNVFILGDLNYFTSGRILTIVKTCVSLWIL